MDLRFITKEIKTKWGRKILIAVLAVGIFVAGMVTERCFFQPSTQSPAKVVVDDNIRAKTVIGTVEKATETTISLITTQNEEYSFIVDRNIRISGARDITEATLQELEGKRVLITYSTTTDSQKLATRITRAE